MKQLHVVLVAVLFLAFAADVSAQRRGGISEGSAAPGLDVEGWMGGDAMAVEAEKVYLVMFFDPQNLDDANMQVFVMLNELLDAYESRDVYMVGIFNGNPDVLGGLADRLTNHENMRLAADRRNSSERAWLRAAGRSDLPTMFVVDRKSKIQFIGAPSELRFQEILALVVDNRYDSQLVRQADRYLTPAENARKVRNFRQCFMHLDKVIELDERVFATIKVTKFEIMLIDQKDPESAYEYAADIIVDNSDDPTLLTWLAELIVTDPRLEDDDRDLDIAMEAADTAFEGFAKDEPKAYALRAMVHYHRDELPEAIELQKAAWRIARPRYKDEYWRTLVAYKEAARRSGVLTSRR